MSAATSQTPPETKPAPVKQRRKVEHVADADCAEEARREGFTKVPSICGMKLLTLRPAYRIVERDTVQGAVPERRVCKRCLAVLGKWQREEDRRVTRRMERQFKEGGND